MTLNKCGMQRWSSDAAYVKEGNKSVYYELHPLPRKMKRPHQRLPVPSPSPEGINPTAIPSGMCSCPVVWDYYGYKIRLTLRAGFLGSKVDGKSGEVVPEVGWLVSHADNDSVRVHSVCSVL